MAVRKGCSEWKGEGGNELCSEEAGYSCVWESSWGLSKGVQRFLNHSFVNVGAVPLWAHQSVPAPGSRRSAELAGILVYLTE